MAKATQSTINFFKRFSCLCRVFTLRVLLTSSSSSVLSFLFCTSFFEVAVKTAKRIIHNNTSPDGSLDNDKAARGILQYRNTPLPDINLSPAQVLLHRQLRDSIPAHPAHYHPHKEWVLTAEEREKCLSKRNHILVQKHDAKAHELTPITLGTNVVVQGKDKKWDRTGRIVEVLPNRQYRIRMFHSGRVTLCNCRFIREYTAITPEVHQPIPSASLPSSTPHATAECDALLYHPDHHR